jgi:hypothetical protein
MEHGSWGYTLFRVRMVSLDLGFTRIWERLSYVRS